MIGKEIVYIAELDEDVDDVVAAHYLYNQNVLKCVVLDPYPKTKEGLERKRQLEELGIDVQKKMPGITKYVFVGGPLTLVAKYIKTHHIDLLVMNGGFVGSNIVPSSQQLKKFKGKEYVRTFNFNSDVMAADYVLKSSKEQISEIILVGKNVCHSDLNTQNGLWSDKEYADLFEKYSVRSDKKQHDMLACHEGLARFGKLEQYCAYMKVRPCNIGLNGNMTKWGSTLEGSRYREVSAAVGYRETKN